MRVLVFGTSNSILRDGWVKGLSEALGKDVVENLSVGMCPSTRFAAHADIDFSKYDAIFFDSVPNDEVLLDSEAFNEFDIENLLSQIFHEISRRTTLIVMGFCMKDFLHTPSPAFQRHKRVCNNTGGHFIDVRDLLLEAGERFGRSAEALYEDHPAHPHRALACEIGHVIGSKLSTILSNVDTPHTSSETAAPSAFTKISIDAPTLQDIKRVHASNSLTRKEFFRLHAGESVEFSPRHIIGLYLNLGTTNGVLRLHNDNKTHDINIYRNDAFGGRFLLNFLALPGDMLVSRLSAEAEPAPGAMNSRHSGATRAADEVLIDFADICSYDTSRIISTSSAHSSSGNTAHELVRSELFSRPMAPRLNDAIKRIQTTQTSASRLNEARDLIAIANRIQSTNRLIDFYDGLIRNLDVVLDEYNHHVFHVELFRNIISRQEFKLAHERIEKIPPEFRADGWPYCLLARALTTNGRHDDALREWEALSLVNPEHPEARAALIRRDKIDQ